MSELTKKHVAALSFATKKSFYGFPAGSNIWPLTVLDEEGITVEGEIIDELLRSGLLAANAVEEPVAGDRTPDPDYAPNLDFEHVIYITDAGRTALAKASQ